MKHPNPERQWGAYLWKTLNGCSKWHWESTIGAANEENKQAHQHMTSIDKLIADTQTNIMDIEPRITPAIGPTPLTPEQFLLKIEHLEETLERLEGGEAIPESTICIEWRCTKPQQKKNRCEHHYTTHKTLWGQGQRCTINQCPDSVFSQTLCKRHYQIERRRRIRNNEPLWEKKQYPKTCTKQGCNKPHEARQLCNTHYKQLRKQEKTHG